MAAVRSSNVVADAGASLALIMTVLTLSGTTALAEPGDDAYLDQPYAAQTPFFDQTEAHLTNREIRDLWSPALAACFASQGRGALQRAQCLSQERQVQTAALQRALTARASRMSPEARKAAEDEQAAWDAALRNACKTSGHGFSASAAIGHCLLDHLIRRRAALEPLYVGPRIIE